jgi:hypothetical protein
MSIATPFEAAMAPLFAHPDLAERRADSTSRAVIDAIVDHGISSTADAEWLVEVDLIRERHAAAWSDFVTRSLVDFAVWQSRPTGRIDQALGDWLLALLSPARPETRRAVLLGVIREAESVPSRLPETLMRDGVARAMLV